MARWQLRAHRLSIPKVPWDRCGAPPGRASLAPPPPRSALTPPPRLPPRPRCAAAGIVSTLTCVVAAIAGAHFGHVLRASDDHVERMVQWGSASLFGVVAGLVLHFSGLPLNTNLYSLSFLLLTCGVSGLLLCAAYIAMDMPRSLPPAAAERLRAALQPFRWLGLNAITMYLLAEGGCVQWLLNCFYISADRNKAAGDREQTLAWYLWPGGAWGGDDADSRTAASHSAAVLIWNFVYIAIWMVVARGMHKRRIYIKL